MSGFLERISSEKMLVKCSTKMAVTGLCFNFKPDKSALESKALLRRQAESVAVRPHNHTRSEGASCDLQNAHKCNEDSSLKSAKQPQPRPSVDSV